MGYMGIDHWGESDAAADFVHIYQEAKTRLKKHKIIENELKNCANMFNTPGSVNVALAIEDNIISKDDLTKNHIKKLIKLLNKLVEESLEKSNWDDESNRIEHENAYKRLLEIINDINNENSPSATSKKK